MLHTKQYQWKLILALLSYKLLEFSCVVVHFFLLSLFLQSSWTITSFPSSSPIRPAIP